MSSSGGDGPARIVGATRGQATIAMRVRIRRAGDLRAADGASVGGDATLGARAAAPSSGGARDRLVQWRRGCAVRGVSHAISFVPRVRANIGTPKISRNGFARLRVIGLEALVREQRAHAGTTRGLRTSRLGEGRGRESARRAKPRESPRSPTRERESSSRARSLVSGVLAEIRGCPPFAVIRARVLAELASRALRRVASPARFPPVTAPAARGAEPEHEELRA